MIFKWQSIICKCLNQAIKEKPQIMKKTSFFILFVLVGAQLFAQPEEKSDLSFAKLSINYTNDYVFMGRTDSLKAPYLTPSLAYFHKSGLFAKGSFSYLTSSGQNRIDLSVLSMGYDAVGKSVYGGGALSAYFFNQDSYAVPSAMVGFLNGYLGYDFKFFELATDASLGLSDELDVFGGIEVLRTFYIFKNHLLVSPSIYVNAGSQNYYNEYYSTRSSQITQGGGYGKGSGKGNQGGGVTSQKTQVEVEEVSKFQVLDYEFSMNITFKSGPLRLVFIPIYAIPVNASTVKVGEDIVFEEILDNVFYWSAGVGYIFK